MNLYTFRRCPYAMRARLILKIAGIQVEQIEVDLKNKPKDMLEYSPKGTVPVLVLDDGTVIDESLDILDWVLTHHKPKGWVELSEEQVNEGEALLSELGEVFIPALNRYKYASRYEGVDIKEEEKKILAYFDKVDVNKPNLIIPSRYSIAIFPFIRQANIANDQWLLRDEYYDLLKWFKAWLEQSSFQLIMQK